MLVVVDVGNNQPVGLLHWFKKAFGTCLLLPSHGEGERMTVSIALTTRPIIGLQNGVQTG